ncbi:hypothetical protein TNCV_4903741 [Trichonephila clavipes]|nr:hypothetical protein TNCV_4903741 [Trichonephila clavipes]
MSRHIHYIKPPHITYGNVSCTQINCMQNNSERRILRLPHSIEVKELIEHMHISYGRDEALFWLNGYINKQTCRIWSEANPQVYVETPLHSEKLTVWCA